MSPESLLCQTAILNFATEQKDCPNCNSRLLAYKSHSRKVTTLDIGQFIVHEKQCYCRECAKSPVFHSEDLHRLVAPGSKFGYDVMVYIGRAVFQRHRTAEEAAVELAARNVKICNSEIRVQARRFIHYLAQAHKESRRALKELLKRQGGYIIHLDGTCDGSSSHLFSAMDELSDLVLLSVKITSEKKEEIAPILKKLKKNYGVPLAVVSDMGKAICGAINDVFPKIRHYICHFHFLRDIGKDLLEQDYKNIREALRVHGICALLRRRVRELKVKMETPSTTIESLLETIRQNSDIATEGSGFSYSLAYVLIEWTLAGKQQGSGCGFPFDMPLVQFHKRLGILAQALSSITLNSQSSKEEKKLLNRLIRDLQPIIEDRVLQSDISSFYQKKEVFDELRDAMRIAMPEGKEGLNDDGKDANIPTIKKNVTKFYKKLLKHSEYAEDGHYGKMAAQMKKYWKKLFADPIQVNTNSVRKTIYPNRTNNSMERLFRSLNRDHRRQTGENSMHRYLDAMLGDTPLVKNLDNLTYMEIILNGSSTLEERFSRIDVKLIRSEMENSKDEVGRIPPGLREIYNQPQWPFDVIEILNLAC